MITAETWEVNFNQYKNLIKYATKSFQRPGDVLIHYDELFQEGAITLFKALQKQQEGKVSNLRTYFQKSLSNRYRTLLKQSINKLPKDTFELDEQRANNCSYLSDNEFDRKEMEVMLKKLIGGLSPLAKQIVKLSHSPNNELSRIAHLRVQRKDSLNRKGKKGLKIRQSEKETRIIFSNYFNLEEATIKKAIDEIRERISCTSKEKPLSL